MSTTKRGALIAENSSPLLQMAFKGVFLTLVFIENNIFFSLSFALKLPKFYLTPKIALKFDRDTMVDRDT